MPPEIRAFSALSVRSGTIAISCEVPDNFSGRVVAIASLFLSSAPGVVVDSTGVPLVNGVGTESFLGLVPTAMYNVELVARDSADNETSHVRQVRPDENFIIITP